jgi:hypothetical protein
MSLTYYSLICKVLGGFVIFSDWWICGREFLAVTCQVLRTRIRVKLGTKGLYKKEIKTCLFYAGCI